MVFRKSSILTAFVLVAAVAVIVSGCGPKEETTLEVKSPTVEKTAANTQSTAAAVKEEALVPSSKPITEERTYFDFESDLNGWEIPMWAQGKMDYVAKGAVVSKDAASKGTSSMKVHSDFPGGMWSASLVEIQMYLNISNYRVISADLYIPPDAPIGLKAKIILTIGDTWKFVEMSNSVPLIPGEWVTVTANIEPGSYDWKRIVPDKDFAKDIRKIAIRADSNRKPKYTGPIYIDNIRVGR